MAKSARANARDPRFRSFRVFFYALYLAAVIAFSVNIIVNVVRSVLVMTPGRKAPTDSALSVRECVGGAERLWRELDGQRQSMSAPVPSRRADQEWSAFRVKWLNSFRDIESRCAVDSRSRAPLKKVYERLDHIQDLYTTHAVQFAGEIGGAIDAFREAVQVAKEDPSMGRFPQP